MVSVLFTHVGDCKL